MADELANDLRYLVKLMDWAAGEGFGNCDGLPDPDETLSEMWERYDPAKGADDYSADALADLMVARLTEEVAAQAREIEGLRAWRDNEAVPTLAAIRVSCFNWDEHTGRHFHTMIRDVLVAAQSTITGGQP